MEEFDLDLERGSFTLHFTASVELPLNLQYLRFLDHEEVASVSYSPLNATLFSVVNETTVVVTLSETDVQTMIDIPGLCLNENSCYIGYTHNLIRDSNNGPTLPGVKRVSNFNPCTYVCMGRLHIVGVSYSLYEMHLCMYVCTYVCTDMCMHNIHTHAYYVRTYIF